MYASYHNTYTRNQASHSTDWRKRAGINKLRNSIKTNIRSLPSGTLQKVSTITTVVERELFSQAASEEEYKNPETIIKVLQNNLPGIICSPQVNRNNTNTPMKNPSSSLSHASRNQSQAGQASPMFADSNINFTGYVTETANHTNNYQFANQRKSHVSVGNKRTSASYSNFKASGGTSNLNSSSRPIFSHLQQQQHRDHVEMDWIGYNGNQSSDFVSKPRESPLSIHGAASSLAERRGDHCYGLESANNTMHWVNYNGNQFSDFLSTPRKSPLSNGNQLYGAAAERKGYYCTVNGQGYLENIFSPPTKRLKIEPTASVSNNDIYKIWDSHMVLTNSPERLPKLHQQEESSFPIFSQVTEKDMESSANAMQDSVSFSNANNAIGIEAILFECKDKYKLRDSYPKRNDEEQDKNGIQSTAKSITDKVIKPKDDLEEGTMSSKTNPITSDASYDVLEQTTKGGTISEGIEAGNTLEDSYLNRDDVKLTNNNPQTDGGSNSSNHTPQKDLIVDKDNVQRENGFNLKNNEMEVTEPKSDLDNGKKSSVSTLNCVSLNTAIMYPITSVASYDVLEQTNKGGTISEGIEVGNTLEDSYLNNDDVKLTDNNPQTDVGGSNSSDHTLQKDLIVDKDNVQRENGFNLENNEMEVTEPKFDLDNVKISSVSTLSCISLNTAMMYPITSVASYDVLEQTKKGGTISEGIEAGNTLEDSYLNSDDVKLINNNPQTDVGGSNSSDHTLQKDPIVDKDNVQRENEFNQSVKNNEIEVTEPKSDLDNGEKSSVSTLSYVSLPENFTCDQIRNHMMSLRQDIGQSILEEEIEIDDNSCSLCGIENRVFQREDICCLSCNKIIKRDTEYYGRKAEDNDNDKEQCFCMACFNNCKGDSIQFNGVSFQKELLNCKNNDYEDLEGWVQCDKCQRWQHQICALFDDKRNLEGNCQYVCPKCCLKEIQEGIRTPLRTANFGAKDLPRTKLSDHVEQRLLSRLEHERAQKAKAEGKNVDEISGAENLTVRVVLSVEKQLKVKKEFLDIVSGANYPPEFPYTSKVILLFQNIDGADVLIYAIFVQEFGSECSHPNHRSVHISYLDSVNHFRPQRETVTGEALRTFVYHEILIGYLGFCKKRGFEKCYIWACPPKKGEDYVLYCHPKSQKTPLTDKLRHWYLSMIRKASEEDIVVNHTNMHDQFFVASERCNSKVTAARLPYFDGDYWSVAVIDEMMRLQKKSKRDYDKMLKQLVTKRALKSMGYTNPSKDTIKDILVMHTLGKTMLTHKEDFIIVQLQYACTLCHEVILSGKRWFCIECKKYQQCERCHTSDTHTSTSGEKHTLCQAVVDDIPCDTKENDIILDNDLFKSRVDILTFCEQNHLQFDTLRHAKYTTMKLIYHLKSSALMHNGDPRCSICYKDDNGSQLSWQCDVCPKLFICSTFYEEKGANCHEHKLRQCSSSTDHCLSENQGSEESKTLSKQQLLKILKHACHCSSIISQPCSYPNCAQMKRRFHGEMKRLISHARGCAVKRQGGCESCKKAWWMLNLHLKGCKDSKCCICSRSVKDSES